MGEIVQIFVFLALSTSTWAISLYHFCESRFRKKSVVEVCWNFYIKVTLTTTQEVGPSNLQQVSLLKLDIHTPRGSTATKSCWLSVMVLTVSMFSANQYMALEMNRTRARTYDPWYCGKEGSRWIAFVLRLMRPNHPDLSGFIVRAVAIVNWNSDIGTIPFQVVFRPNVLEARHPGNGRRKPGLS